MTRFTFAFPLALPLALALAACGSSNSSNNNTPDAPKISTTDATPPDASPPDALVCVAPTMMCTPGSCTNTDTDEANCGSCGHACQGGAACLVHECTCPASSPIPATIDVGAQDMIFPITQLSWNIGVAPTTGSNGTNALLSIVNAAATGGTVVNKDYTLTAPSGLPSPPVMAVAYNITSISPPAADGYYVAVSGTVNYSKLCATEMKGTLTNVKFQGTTGGLMSGLQVDPNGCSFTMAKVDFDIQQGTPCP